MKKGSLIPWNHICNKWNSLGHSTNKCARVSVYEQNTHVTPTPGSMCALYLFVAIAPPLEVCCPLLNGQIVQAPPAAFWGKLRANYWLTALPKKDLRWRTLTQVWYSSFFPASWNLPRCGVMKDSSWPSSSHHSPTTGKTKTRVKL